MRRLAIVSVGILVVCLISPQLSCRSDQNKKDSGEEILVYASIAPVQFFVDQVSGGLVKTEVMVRPGFSPATYEPLPSQMSKLSDARAFFMVGHLGFEEAWKSRIEEGNPNLQVFDLSEGVNMLEGGHIHHDGESIDPHIWLAPNEVRIMVGNIMKGLSTIDTMHRRIYEDNAAKILQRIDSIQLILDDRLTPIKGGNVYIFHPTLGYFARQYGLVQISIEHEGKEPTPKMLESLVEQLKQEENPLILVQREFDRKHAEVLARSANARIVEIHPLEYDWFAVMDELVRALAED